MIALLLAALLVPETPRVAPGVGAPLPPALEEVGIDEHPGAEVPWQAVFTDPSGRAAPLRAFVSGRRPILLTLVYYRCPMLCNLVVGNLVQSLRRLDWQLGREYDALTVSFDPADTPADAAEKQRGYLQAMAHPQLGDWPFLVGREPDLRALLAAVGLRVYRDAATGQFAHVAAAFVLTPRGQVSRYLYGVDFSEQTVKLALFDAAGGRIGGTLERIILHCYSWDPASRRYGLFVKGFIRTGGLIVFVALAAALVRFWRRELRARLVS